MRSCVPATVCAPAAVHADELDMEKIAFFFFPLPYSLSITRSQQKGTHKQKAIQRHPFFWLRQEKGGSRKKGANEMKAFIKGAFMLICVNACRRVQGCKAELKIYISNDVEPVLLILIQ